MKKTLIVSLFLITAICLLTRTVYAIPEAGHSAILSSVSDGHLSQSTDDRFQIQKIIIRNMLEKYNSPLVDSVDTFIRVCTEYDLNCYLLPSIALVESGLGKQVKKNSFNPFGWDGGEHIFSSWDESIETVGKALRENYIDRGAKSLDGVGRIYAASPTWATKVRSNMKHLQTAEEQYRLKSLPDDVEL